MKSFHRFRREASVLALVALGAIAGVANGAGPAYPDRPIRLVVGFPPGGATDALARLIAPKMAEGMGQPWIVDNRGGAGGNLGTETVARAAPDGYTVLFALDTQLTANPSLYKLPFSVQDALQPVTLLAKFENVLLVNPSVQAQTVADFVALARSNPNAFNYGSSGVGSTLHLTAEMMKSRMGINMVHVPYKGAAQAITGVLGGEVQVMVGAIPSTIPYVKSGGLRALATTGAKRNKLTPDVPTVAESGYAGFESVAWFGLVVPAGTPRAVADRLRAEAIKVLDLADVQAAMLRMGLDAESSSPEQLAARIRAETAATVEIIKKAGVQAN